MIESQVGALFAEIADGEPVPPRVDIPLARRRGRARLRWRRACVAGGSVLTAAAVAALAVTVGPLRPGPGPVAAGPAAPRQFSPLVPYVSFGWLPAGNSLVAGGARPKVLYLNAGRNARNPSFSWNLNVYAAGQCHVTGPARELKCSTQDLEGLTARITGPAPAVRGHRAFWAGSDLVWQYARGGWAWLSLPYPYASPKLSTAAKREAAKRDAVKIAGHVRYGAPTPPLVFPAQLTRLPSQWRVSSVYYLPDAGVLRAERFALGTGNPDLGADGGLEYQTNLPYFSIDPATPHKGYCYRAPGSTSETINGYRVVLTHQDRGSLLRQDLCAAHAGGLALYISQFGAHPPIDLASLFGNHLRLLGTNPANWTTNPIG